MKDNKKIKSTIYLLGDNIDTDQILTAEFMKVNPSTEEGYKELGTLAMCGLPEGYPPFIDKNTGKAINEIIIAGDNFGCGSSREHAPMALGSSGVRAIVAKNFARIFYRNCISTGELIPIESDSLDLSILENGDEVEIDLEQFQLSVVKNNKKIQLKDFGALADIIESGGLFPYAKKMNVY